MKNFTIPEVARRIVGWFRSRRTSVLALILVAAIAIPRDGSGQIVPSPSIAILSAGLGSVASAITNVIGGGLNKIFSIFHSLETFEETVVWPEDLIAEARTVVGSVRELFGQTRKLFQVPVASATLPNSKQLEKTLLSADPLQANRLNADYAAVYLTVPTPIEAPPEVRNLIDMTDAVAQAAMKRAIEIDAISDIEIQASDQIIDQVRSAAPGSAPILEAGAAAWLVKANALTQSALTELMRLRAIDIANTSAQIKIDAKQGTSLRDDITNGLRR